MIEIEILRRLTEEMNISVSALARFCHCSPSAMANYVRGVSLPTGAKLIGIKEGLRKYKEMINQIIEE